MGCFNCKSKLIKLIQSLLTDPQTSCLVRSVPYADQTIYKANGNIHLCVVEELDVVIKWEGTIFGIYQLQNGVLVPLTTFP